MSFKVEMSKNLQPVKYKIKLNFIWKERESLIELKKFHNNCGIIISEKYSPK